jgi:hypothetical protein
MLHGFRCEMNFALARGCVVALIKEVAWLRDERSSSRRIRNLTKIDAFHMKYDSPSQIMKHEFYYIVQSSTTDKPQS